MKNIRIYLLLLAICGCKSFDKDYYEKITQIEFPRGYKIVATADNGEFLTITIVDLDKSSCKKFANDNNFQSVNEGYPMNLMGLHLLDSSLGRLPNPKQLLQRHIEKRPGKVGWIYLLDTISYRLYCEVEYPDYAGN